MKYPLGKNGKHLSKQCIFCRSQTEPDYKGKGCPRTSTMCFLCKVPLCIECFLPYHKIPDYKNYNKHLKEIALRSRDDAEPGGTHEIDLDEDEQDTDECDESFES